MTKPPARRRRPRTPTRREPTRLWRRGTKSHLEARSSRLLHLPVALPPSRVSGEQLFGFLGCFADTAAFVEPAAGKTDDGQFAQGAGEKAAPGTLVEQIIDAEESGAGQPATGFARRVVLPGRERPSCWAARVVSLAASSSCCSDPPEGYRRGVRERGRGRRGHERAAEPTRQRSSCRIRGRWRRRQVRRRRRLRMLEGGCGRRARRRIGAQRRPGRHDPDPVDPPLDPFR